ncbi:MAG: superoxide dismutase [Planctomycetes bacterium]|nr:superoxide dismutase [Planctomycetota bacterium]
MAHEKKDYSALVGKLDGLSAKQIEAHLGLYAGYVNKLNEIEAKLKETDRGTSNYSYGAFSELKRREAVAFNGTYLHELYFDNLGHSGQPSAELTAAINKSFGSLDAFLADLKATALCTPGWAITTFNRKDGLVHNYVMYEHHIGFPVHQEPLIALDSWEHAFMIDYGTGRAGYVDAFFKILNWDVVNSRYASLKK